MFPQRRMLRCFASTPREHFIRRNKRITLPKRAASAIQVATTIPKGGVGFCGSRKLFNYRHVVCFVRLEFQWWQRNRIRPLAEQLPVLAFTV